MWAGGRASCPCTQAAPSVLLWSSALEGAGLALTPSPLILDEECATEDAFAAPVHACHCLWRVLAGIQLPGLCCSGTQNSLLTPCGCSCFPCSRSVTWAACSTLCTDILSPQILSAPLTGTADPPLQNISRAQENVFLSRCHISLHLMYPTGAWNVLGKDRRMMDGACSDNEVFFV